MVVDTFNNLTSRASAATTAAATNCHHRRHHCYHFLCRHHLPSFVSPPFDVTPQAPFYVSTIAARLSPFLSCRQHNAPHTPPPPPVWAMDKERKVQYGSMFEKFFLHPRLANGHLHGGAPPTSATVFVPQQEVCSALMRPLSLATVSPTSIPLD
jgi:hypothetical protein